MTLLLILAFISCVGIGIASFQEMWADYLEDRKQDFTLGFFLCLGQIVAGVVVLMVLGRVWGWL